MRFLASCPELQEKLLQREVRRVVVVEKQNTAETVWVYNRERGKEVAMSGGPLGGLSIFLPWHGKAPSSACYVSNLSFDMSGAIIPSFVTSFDQRMKNSCLTQTKLLLKKGQLQHTGVGQGETRGNSP